MSNDKNEAEKGFKLVKARFEGQDKDDKADGVESKWSKGMGM